MKIANKVAFGTISYLLKGDVHVNIKFRRMGYWKEEIFDGEMSELWEKRDLRWKLEKMPVNALFAEGDVLFIGVEEDCGR
jgi:hypothetical protein